MKNERMESALAWCRENKLDPTRLKRFNRESKKKSVKKRSVRGDLGKKEFEEMCKKAGVKKESLCKTVFTKDL